MPDIAVDTDPVAQQRLVVINNNEKKKAGRPKGSQSLKKKLAELKVPNARPSTLQRWRMYESVIKPDAESRVQVQDDLVEKMKEAFGEGEFDVKDTFGVNQKLGVTVQEYNNPLVEQDIQNQGKFSKYLNDMNAKKLAEFKKQNRSASRIQNVLRDYQLRSKKAKAKLEVETASAKKIQNLYRSREAVLNTKAYVNAFREFRNNKESQTEKALFYLSTDPAIKLPVTTPRKAVEFQKFKNAVEKAQSLVPDYPTKKGQAGKKTGKEKSEAIKRGKAVAKQMKINRNLEADFQRAKSN